MHFDWTTFALQTVNFAILVWLLHRFLYKPVLSMVDARRADVERQYAEAHAAETRANETRAAVEAERAAIGAERAAALKDAAAQAEMAAAARRKVAEQDAAALVDGTRRSLSLEREQALGEMRRASLDLGADIAARLLAEIPVRLRTEAWLERVTQHLAALPKPEFDALARQLANSASLKVVTASALPADDTERWRSELKASLGDAIAIEFAVDPQLVAGVELHFPNAVLRFSWQSALAALRAETEVRADHR